MALGREGRDGAGSRKGDSGPAATEVKDTTQIRGNGASSEGGHDGAGATSATEVPRDASAIDTRVGHRDGASDGHSEPDASERAPRDTGALDTPTAPASTTDRPVADRDPAADRTVEQRAVAPPADRSADQTAVAPADRPVERRDAIAPAGGAAVAAERSRIEMLRVPGFAPIAPFAGWLAAWGAAALAAYCLLQAGLSLGFGLSIADGGPGSDGLSAGVWLLIAQAGAFLFGGYVAARMARNRGTTHAVLAWVLAMLATGADALALELRDGGESVLAQLFIPFWNQNGMAAETSTFLALGAFAVAALAGAVVGGILGSGANRAATREVPVDADGKPLGAHTLDSSRETVRT